MSTKKTKTKKAAAKAPAKQTVKVAKTPEAVTVAAKPGATVSRRFKVWANGWENAARVITAAEPTAAALDYCAAVYPVIEGNRCASVSASESALGGVVRVFIRDSKPVPYLFTEEVK